MEANLVDEEDIPLFNKLFVEAYTQQFTAKYTIEIKCRSKKYIISELQWSRENLVKLSGELQFEIRAKF